MYALDDVFARLPKSRFRQRFRLAPAERAYLREKGWPSIQEHARDFVMRRLAPAVPLNNGKQTPFRGHPVFVAQHATATCCRGCLLKWHGIPQNRALNSAEQAHVVEAIARWLGAQGVDTAEEQIASPEQLSLFTGEQAGKRRR